MSATAITAGVYGLAAVAEIAGCFAFWAWARLNGSALWLVPGVGSLMLFAWLLTRVDAAFAGRAYAVYGGVFTSQHRCFGFGWSKGACRTDGTCWAPAFAFSEPVSSCSGPAEADSPRLRPRALGV